MLRNELLDRRRHLLQPVDVERARVLDDPGGEHGEGDWHLLRHLFDAPGRHDHRLGQPRRRQRQVDGHGLAGREHDLAARVLEPVQPALDAVLARDQRADAIGAPPVGHRFDRHAGGAVDDHHGDARRGRAGHVADDPRDRARGGLRHGSHRQEHHAKHCEHIEHSARHRSSPSQPNGRPPCRAPMARTAN
jgi:hypothetical protein